MKPGTDRPRLLPEDPFLVYQEPPYWRWLSFTEADGRLSRWRSSLADLEPESRVGIPASPREEALLADLAVRSCGLVAVPLPEVSDERVPRGLASPDVLLDFVLSGATASGPEASESIERRRLADTGQEAPQAEDRLLGGCVVSFARGDEEHTALLAPLDLVASVDRLTEAWRGSGGYADRREIVLHGRSLMGWDERVIIEWAVCVGAALVVTSAPEELAAAAFWARPTVLHGGAEELATWSQLFRAGEARDRGLKARFRRLRRVIVCGSQPLEEESSLFFAGLGADVVKLDEVGNQL